MGVGPAERAIGVARTSLILWKYLLQSQSCLGISEGISRAGDAEQKAEYLSRRAAVCLSDDRRDSQDTLGRNR